jgi:hypothetical protein
MCYGAFFCNHTMVVYQGTRVFEGHSCFNRGCNNWLLKLIVSKSGSYFINLRLYPSDNIGRIINLENFCSLELKKAKDLFGLHVHYVTIVTINTTRVDYELTRKLLSLDIKIGGFHVKNNSTFFLSMPKKSLLFPFCFLIFLCFLFVFSFSFLFFPFLGLKKKPPSGAKPETIHFLLFRRVYGQVTL